MPQEFARQGSSPEVIETARWAIPNKIKAVALHYATKAAISDAYKNEDYEAPPISFWETNRHDIGAVTGNGVLDADLDCMEAVELATTFLPPTAAVFGRRSKPASHRFYRVNDFPHNRMVGHDPVTGETIMELRYGGGHQTVLPGSTHQDTKEPIEWVTPGTDPVLGHAEAEPLIAGFKRILITTTVARYIWMDGYRNEATKHLSGMFGRLGWSEDETVQLVRAVMRLTGDDDKTREKTVRATYKKLASDKRVTGSASLKKMVADDRVISKIREWAGDERIGVVEELNERFAVVDLAGQFRVAMTDVPFGERPVFYRKEDFQNLFGTEWVTIDDKPKRKVDVWLASTARNSYRRVEFLPGVEDSGDVLNLWPGFAVRPNPQGSCDAWLELLREVICGGDLALYNWCLHWFANIVREPMKKALTSLVLIGIQGAGKSLLLDFFSLILGSAALTVSNPEHVHGKFNKHLATALFVHSAEALYGHDKKHRAIIKELITGTKQMLEQKGIDAFEVRNFLRLALTSNDRNPAPIESGDRRFTVISMGRRKASPDLVERVVAEMEGDGPAALLHLLLTMEYDPKVPRTNVKNEDHAAAQAVVRNPVEAWWQETLERGQLVLDELQWATDPDLERKTDWPVVVLTGALLASFQTWAGSARTSSNEFLDKLTQMVGLSSKQMGKKVKRFDNRKPSREDLPPAARDIPERSQAFTQFPDLAACRAAFEQHIGSPIEWPEVEETAPPRELIRY